MLRRLAFAARNVLLFLIVAPGLIGLFLAYGAYEALISACPRDG